LIATKLNIAAGAMRRRSPRRSRRGPALIGRLVVPPVGGGFLSPASTSALTQTLDDFNNGIIPPVGSVHDQVHQGRLKSLYQ
jgi:hypothetical protein